MLEHLQGVRPEHVYIINGEGVELAFRTDDYFFYFESLEREFLEAQRALDPEQQPLPEPRTDHRDWQSHADEILDRMDNGAFSTVTWRKSAEVSAGGGDMGAT